MNIAFDKGGFIQLRLSNGETIDIQAEADSIIVSAQPPKVIELKKITGIYVQIGTVNLETITCK